ncbi:hypothetical protein Z965_07045 [Clostridium novyi A str. BKT29909]|uniref:hypothetical protein n=1 Tax=Clostridium TaxID=1485 RepID=UPI0004DAB1D8|nr:MULTISPECIES: hypothetical protein [Clostridium]KEH86826.1 hypothetical protein Z965_07045 [Clostridium novyi A str. BKT29909]KEH92239.1 hypothetical protein Z963_06535 [Clostridium botulinum C/D str. It1]
MQSKISHKLKISEKEKILLIIVGILALVVLYYQFSFTKQSEKIKALSDQRTELQEKVDSLPQLKIKNEKRKKEIKIVNANIYDSSSTFFPEIIQEKIITTLDDMINKCNVQCNSMSISEPVTETFKDEDKKYSKEKEKNPLEDLVNKYHDLEGNTSVKGKEHKPKKTNNSKDEKSEPMATHLSITVNFTGSYGNVLKFIDEIKGFYKRIVISNISFAVDEKGISGNMVLDFYAIPKIYNDDTEYTQWNFADEYGRVDVFKYNGQPAQNGDATAVDNTTNTTSGEAFEYSKPQKQYDFYCSLKPISSDLPTVMIGKAKDQERKTYVYADNDGIEDVEIYLVQKGNKYFYRYKTKGEQYPKNGKEQEFTPNSKEFNMKIYSTSRNSKNDKAGANIKIYNKTNLKLNVDVQGDDKERPRVNIIKQGGTINVSKF